MWKYIHLFFVMDVYMLLLCFTGAFIDVFGLEPRFDIPWTNVSAQEGHTAILPCAVDYLGRYKVVWTDQGATLLTLDERRIIDDPRISIERPYTRDWNLHIRKTAYSDRGQYLCQINTYPPRAKKVTLNVLVPSKIVDELSSRDQTVHEFQTVRLVCNVTGVPTPDVTWYKLLYEDLEIKQRVGTTGEVLTIPNVSRYSDGTYVCMAYNNVDPAVVRHMKVDVQYAPDVKLPTKRIGQSPGREAILDCKINAYPQNIAFWLKGNMYIDFVEEDKYQVEFLSDSEDSKRKTLRVRVKNLQQDDYGEYSCYAENMMGNDSEAMILYDNSTHIKYKTTTKGPNLIESTSREISNISISQGADGNKTVNPWPRQLTEQPELQTGRGNGSSNSSNMTGEEQTRNVASKHVTSVLYSISLIATLVLLWR